MPVPAFCGFPPVHTPLFRPRNFNTCAVHPEWSMSMSPAKPPLKLELDAFLTAVPASLSPPVPPLRRRHIQTSEEQRAEDAYRSAKAVYKRAKDVYKGRSITEYADPSPAQQQEAEAVYRAAKLKYKEAKMTLKTIRKAKEALLKEEVRSPAPPTIDGVEMRTASAIVVAVCGGKTCKRMGADAVADILQRETRKGFLRDGVVHVDAQCMKMCGGGGPTVRFGADTIKVDFKKAVSDAIEGGGKGLYSNRLRSVVSRM